jgi:hypothetical protein
MVHDPSRGAYDETRIPFPTRAARGGGGRLTTQSVACYGFARGPIDHSAVQQALGVEKKSFPWAVIILDPHPRDGFVPCWFISSRLWFVPAAG